MIITENKVFYLNFMLNKKRSINIKIGGQAGTGVKITGLVLTKTLSRNGLATFAYQEYPSLIRGGHNTFQVHTSANPVYSQIRKVDILIAFDSQTIELHQKELTQGSLIIYDPEMVKVTARNKGQYLALPLRKISLEEGNVLMANSVALGGVMALINITTDKLKQVIAEIFKKKGKKVIEANQTSAQKGYNFARNNFTDKIINLEKGQKKVKRMVITGNEAVALGAIAAGLKFYSAYPMTPATSILHYLAAQSEKYNIIVKQPEDEIGAINQTIGASFAGVRAMTATSGGGFSLMTEGFGLAGISETPIVIVESMRAGPASGMPTWSGQGDLKFVINASQDEFPRVVLAPGDAQECFDLTRKAFYFTEKYQLPVIILLDKNISESFYSPLLFKTIHLNQRYSFTKPQKGFLRYKINKNGISPRCFLGERNGHHIANSYEHSEDGLFTEESGQRNKMMDKRKRKFASLKKEIIPPKLYGPKKAKISLISWGSNKGPILEALKILNKTQKQAANFLHLNFLWPFPDKTVTEFIKSARQVICPEGNSTGQLASLIREQTGLKVKSFLKYDGRPFYPEEIKKEVDSY